MRSATRRCPSTTRSTRAQAAGSAALPAPASPPQATRRDTRGQVALFTTCYGNRNEPELAQDLAAVFEHNGIEVTLLPRRSAAAACPSSSSAIWRRWRGCKETEHSRSSLRLVEAGYDIVAPIPSCVLMFKQELPLMFPEDAEVQRVAAHIFDPFEYLMLRHKAGLLRTDFKARARARSATTCPVTCACRTSASRRATCCGWCPDTTVEVIERCSGHNGTYAVKSEFRDASMKIGAPGDRSACRTPRPTTTPATARWPGTRSRAASPSRTRADAIR